MFSDPVTWYASRARYEEPARCGRTKIVAKIREEGSERMAGYFSVSPAETFFARIYRRVKSNLARLRYPRVYIYTCWSATPATFVCAALKRVRLPRVYFHDPYLQGVVVSSIEEEREKRRKTAKFEVRTPFVFPFPVRERCFDDPESGGR